MTVRRGNILLVGAFLVMLNLTVLSAFLASQPGLWPTYLIQGIVSSAVIASLAWLVFFLSSKTLLIIKTVSGREIEFFSQGKSKEALALFLEDLYATRNVFFRTNFFFIDYESSRESELEKMQWLLEEGVITESEFEVVKEEIENTLE